MRIAEYETAIGHFGADNPFVVLRDLIKTRLRPAAAGSRPRFRTCITSRLGRAEACEGGLGAFARYTPLRRFPMRRDVAQTRRMGKATREDAANNCAEVFAHR